MASLTEIYAINVVLHGVQKFQQDLLTIQNSMRQTSTFVANAAGGIGLAMLGMAAAATRASVQFALEQDRLNRLIRRTWRDSSDAILEYAEHLQSLSGINEAIILRAAENMGALGMSAEETQRALKAVVETVGARELADTAVEDIAKVIALLQTGSPTAMRQLRMLERQHGIPITKMLGEATGLSPEEAFKLPGKQLADILVEGLEKLYAGGLGAFETPQAYMRRIRADIGEFWEETGMILIQGFVSVAEHIHRVVNWLKELNQAMGGKLGLGIILVLVAGAVKLVKYWFDMTFGAAARLTAAMQALTAAMTRAAGATGAAATASGVGAAAGAATLGGRIKGFGGKALRFLKGFAPTAVMLGIGPLMDWLTGGRGAGMEKVGNVVENMAMGAAMGAILGPKGAIIGGIVGTIKGIVEAATGRSGFGFGKELQYGQDPATQAAKETAKNTREMVDLLEDSRAGLVGGRELAKRAMSDMEIQIALARALGTGVA